MLSIGKLAAGQASYYLDQARGRVDVVDTEIDGTTASSRKPEDRAATRTTGRWS